MKKIVTIIMTICLLASTLCVTSFAAESTSVIKVQYDSETKEFSAFDDGWNHAMEQANDGKEVYVTLLKDWNAVDGQFTDNFLNGAGFDYDAIYFADDVTVTLDLNGHTIDRGLSSPEFNGEVMFINDNANVTIKNGTVKGGYSYNGAGGIHIENANVDLIDLVFTGNRVRDDDGSALQHNDGGELYMKNCSFVNNRCEKKGLAIYGTVFLDEVDTVLIEDCYFADNSGLSYGGGIYASDIGDFQIKNSTFENLRSNQRGGAIWVGGENCKLYIYNCNFKSNTAGGQETGHTEYGRYGGAIYADKAALYVYDTVFSGNYARWDGGAVYFEDSAPSYFYRCTFDGNSVEWDGGAFFCDSDSTVYTYGCTFINNRATETGGTVYVDSGSKFELHSYSDDEKNNPGIIKGGKAGEIGGGIYLHEDDAMLVLEGNVFVKGNTSSKGEDDVYIENGRNVRICKITSPEGSIGLRYKSDDGGSVAEIDESDTAPSIKSFFANNEGVEIKLGSHNRSETDPIKVRCITMTGSNAASIFGEGSLTMIVAILALVASLASVGVSVALYKKKSVPLTASGADKSDDEA